MTHEEAKNILLTFIGKLVRGGRKSGKSMLENRQFEAFAKAIEALETRIPKKPIIRETEDYFGYVKYILCPNCEKVEFGFNQPCFCERCGQAIDWR